MSEHGEKSQELLETLLQQLSKGTLNSFDLENAKSFFFFFFLISLFILKPIIRK